MAQNFPKMAIVRMRPPLKLNLSNLASFEILKLGLKKVCVIWVANQLYSPANALFMEVGENGKTTFSL